MPSSDFSRRAHNYEANAHIQERLASSLVESSLDVLDKKKLEIADLGCGPGTIAL